MSLIILKIKIILPRRKMFLQLRKKCFGNKKRNPISCSQFLFKIQRWKKISNSMRRSLMFLKQRDFLKYKRFKKIAWIWSHHLHLQWKFKSLAGKFTWEKRQNIAGCCQQTFENKKFVDITQQCFALLLQVNFSANQ